MIVKQNDMTYNDEDPRCQLFLGSTGATQGMASNLIVAFITVIDDRTQHQKRYFGVYSREAAAQSIREIMNKGGKWPHPFDEKIPYVSTLQAG